MDELVSIVIVTWNSARDIGDCLNSLLAQDYQNYKIIVVDNASGDNTVEIIEKNYPQVGLIKSKINNYFAKGNNIGIEFALLNHNPKYIALINPDTVAATNWLSAQVEIMRSDAKIGLIGPKIYFYDSGKINSAGLVYDGFMQAYDRGVDQDDNGQFDEQEEIAAVSGTSMFFRAEVLKQLGGFWSVLQMYLEDLELSIRTKRLGYKVIYTPKTTVRHKYMRSTSQNPKVLNWKMRNWLLIAWRHYPLRSKLAVTKIFFQNAGKVKTMA